MKNKNTTLSEHFQNSMKKKDKKKIVQSSGSTATPFLNLTNLALNLNFLYLVKLIQERVVVT
jgi:hypothetical protein